MVTGAVEKMATRCPKGKGPVVPQSNSLTTDTQFFVVCSKFGEVPEWSNGTDLTNCLAGNLDSATRCPKGKGPVVPQSNSLTTDTQFFVVCSKFGEVPEWSNGTDSKSVDPFEGPRVRIPASPPSFYVLSPIFFWTVHSYFLEL